MDTHVIDVNIDSALPDIDECSLDLDDCSDNAVCTNTEGSFECMCLPGFTGDGVNCTGLSAFLLPFTHSDR